jgi:hypothetical protein
MTSHTKKHQYRPNITLNNTSILHTHETKILGATYDPSMTFGPHINNIVNNTNIRLNSLWALGGTKFGKNKETLAPTYKQFIRTVLAYASPAWAPALSNTNIQKLQTLQNKALRIVTGCTQSTPIKHLHAVTKILPIKAHLDMREHTQP